MIRDDVKTAYSRTKWALGLRGLLGITLGIFIIARPLESVAAFALVIAIWALVDGMTNIVRSFMVRGVAPHWWVLLISGIIGVAFGVASLYLYPVLSLTYAVIWTAFWLLTGGGMAAYVAILEKQSNLPWGWTMTLGVVTIAAGVLAILYPGITLAGLISLIAAVGIVGGTFMLVGVAKLQNLQREFQDTVRSFTDGGRGRQAV